MKVVQATVTGSSLAVGRWTASGGRANVFGFPDSKPPCAPLASRLSKWQRPGNSAMRQLQIMFGSVGMTASQRRLTSAISDSSCDQASAAETGNTEPRPSFQIQREQREVEEIAEGGGRKHCLYLAVCARGPALLKSAFSSNFKRSCGPMRHNQPRKK